MEVSEPAGHWFSDRVAARLGARPHLLGLIAVGGMAGTELRWALEAGFGSAPGSWPWATLGINLVGSFVLGGLLEGLAATGPDAGWRRKVRLGVGTGVLGGFTTYSTFAVEAVQLVRAGQAWLALGYVGLSVVGGIALAFAGMRLARVLVRRGRR